MYRCSALLVVALLLSSCSDSGSTGNSLAAANPLANEETKTPTANQGGDTIEPVTSFSVVEGDITLFNDLAATSEININLRGTDINSAMRSTGEFELYLPQADVDRSYVIDISGVDVISKSLSVLAPAEAERVSVDAKLSGRAAPISFSLENGAEISNPLSSTRVSVTVPENAFEFSDGTLAIG